MTYYVYIIRSIKYPKTVYCGYTTNVRTRLQNHNLGWSIHTKKNRPWELVAFMGFVERRKALEFEYYLKSQSGRAFLTKRICEVETRQKDGGGNSVEGQL